MKKILQLAGLILVLQLAFLNAAQANEAATKKTIAGKYQSMVKAYHNADSETLIKDIAPDFTAVLPGNRIMKRAEYVTKVRMMCDALLTTNSVSSRITKLTIEKNRVIVVASHSLDLVVKINNAQRYKENSASRDIWVKSGGQWKIKRSEILRATITLDGKPVKL